MLPWFVCTVLLIVIMSLLIKIYTVYRALDDICGSFEEHLSGDTNTLLSVSSGDRHITEFAAKLNGQLKLLREQRLKYAQGDLALKETVTNISHDLRTPLTAVSGYLELLMRKEDAREAENRSGDTARYLSCIKNRTEAMKSLTEELFRYTTSLPTEKLTLEPLDIRIALEECLLDFYGAMVQKGMVPELSIPDAPVVRPLNRTALNRVFANILQNALKYGEGNLTVSLRETGELLFGNDAPSLDPVQAEKLFNRFFTVENAGNSTGLGLSIAKTLVREMEGDITAEYEKNRLSIRIVFPEG